MITTTADTLTSIDLENLETNGELLDGLLDASSPTGQKEDMLMHVVALSAVQAWSDSWLDTDSKVSVDAKDRFIITLGENSSTDFGYCLKLSDLAQTVKNLTDRQVIMRKNMVINGDAVEALINFQHLGAGLYITTRTAQSQTDKYWFSGPSITAWNKLFGN